MGAHYGFAADDYVITTIDATSSRSATQTFLKYSGLGACSKAFRAKGPSIAKVKRTSSFSVHSGVKVKTQRGHQSQTRDIDFSQKVTDLELFRVLNYLRASGRFSDDELIPIFNLHRSLSPHRVKQVVIESGSPKELYWSLSPQTDDPVIQNPNKQEERYSIMRIYDSSPVMKSYGRRYEVPKHSARDTLEVAEMVFRDFDLNQALRVNGVDRSAYTWSLGMVNVVGSQANALATLSSHVAELLDLHYNQSDYFQFGHLDSIANDDVDIVFYGDRSIQVYYQRKFELKPLQDSNGDSLKYRKNGRDFYVFHMKGSDFIKMFFDQSHYDPSYGVNRAARNEDKTHQALREAIDQFLPHYDPKDFEVRDFEEFTEHLSLLADVWIAHHQGDPELKSERVFKAFMGLLLLRRNLPDDIFAPSNGPQMDRAMTNVLRTAENLNRAGVTANPSMDPAESAYAYLEMLDLILDEPMAHMLRHLPPVDN